MTETMCREYQDYFFLTEEEYLTKQSEGKSNCLVKVKLFNRKGNEDFDRNIYLDFPEARDEKIICDCVSEIVTGEFTHINSWVPEISIKM